MGLGPSPSLAVEGYVTRTGGSGAISGRYGVQRPTGRHEGLDIAAAAGTPVASLNNGVVTRAEYSTTYGNVIYVRQDSGHEVRYAHLGDFATNIRRGSRVEAGQIIGFVGSTGRSSGNHLHLEIRKDGRDLDPTSIYNANRWIVGGPRVPAPAPQPTPTPVPPPPAPSTPRPGATPQVTTQDTPRLSPVAQLALNMIQYFNPRL
jgi:murein DD-endopeptidase MepM/ murein hydrolase activator NlpD